MWFQNRRSKERREAREEHAAALSSPPKMAPGTYPLGAVPSVGIPVSSQGKHHIDHLSNCTYDSIL